jgi:hypothetical protein
MSDFYQILKREIETDSPAASAKKKTENLDMKKTVVENSAEKNAAGSDLMPLKKNRRVNKSSPPRSRLRLTSEKKISRKKKSSPTKEEITLLSAEPANPVWLTLAEAGKICGVRKKTIKRALRLALIKYKIVESRYQVDLRSAILYCASKKKIWNKLLSNGLGQYVEKWKE